MNYVDVVNDSDSYIKFSLVYTLNKELVVDETPDFGPKKIRRLDLPSNAIAIIVRVSIRLSSGKFKEFFTDSVQKSERRCYGVRGTSTNPICQLIDCSILPNRDFVDVKNKSRTMIKYEVIYTIKGTGYKEESSEIKPLRSKSMIIPREAENVQIKVFMLEAKPHEDIWHPIYVEYLKHPFKVCYEVSGQLPIPTCKKVPCNIGNDNNGSITPCYCCCCCCCHSKK